jgi:hypothetical protein
VRIRRDRNWSVDLQTQTISTFEVELCWANREVNVFIICARVVFCFVLFLFSTRRKKKKKKGRKWGERMQSCNGNNIFWMNFLQRASKVLVLDQWRKYKKKNIYIGKSKYYFRKICFLFSRAFFPKKKQNNIKKHKHSLLLLCFKKEKV